MPVCLIRQQKAGEHADDVKGSEGFDRQGAKVAKKEKKSKRSEETDTDTARSMDAIRSFKSSVEEIEVSAFFGCCSGV